MSFNNVPSTFDTINQEEEKEESKMDIVPNELPEGFFDDPIMDAKVKEYTNFFYICTIVFCRLIINYLKNMRMQNFY